MRIQLRCRYERADLCRSRIKFYLNLKITQWPWIEVRISHYVNIVHLWEQCPINKRLKSLLKCENPKCYIFAMKIWPWPGGQGQMVQWDKICIFPQAFQIIKPGHDISLNGWGIPIYVKTTLTSISRSLLWFVKFFNSLKGPSLPLTNV